MRPISLLVIPLFVGQINVKLARNSLASERYGMVPSVRLLGLRLTWRRWFS